MKRFFVTVCSLLTAAEEDALGWGIVILIVLPTVGEIVYKRLSWLQDSIMF